MDSAQRRSPSPHPDASRTRITNQVALLVASSTSFLRRADLFNHFDTTLDEKRKGVVRWILYVLTNASPDLQHVSMARDTAIQIFDTYLVEALLQHPPLQDDPKFINSAAAVALSWGMRLHSDGPGALDLTGFKELDTYDGLHAFEKQMLATLFNAAGGTCMQPQMAPACFVCELLHLIEGTPTYHPSLPAVAESLIVDFWEHGESMLLAPSTIAVAAIIMAFSVLQLDCSDWLALVPDFCLYPLGDTTASAASPPPSSPSSSSSSSSTLPLPRPAVPPAIAHAFDVDCCLQCFSHVLTARRRALAASPPFPPLVVPTIR